MRSEDVRIHLLGGLRAWRGMEEISLSLSRAPRLGAALAFLAYPQVSGRPNAPVRRRAVTRRDLIKVLWPEEADTSRAKTRLRTLLKDLRAKLEPAGTPPQSVLATQGEGVFLTAAVTSDMDAFFQALGQASQGGQPLERAVRWGAAMAQLSGDLLPGSMENWVVAERLALAETVLAAVESLAAALTQAGEGSGAAAHQALPQAQASSRFVEMGAPSHAWHDRLACGLMRLHLLAGQPQQALVRYGELLQALQPFGECPSPAAQALRAEARQAVMADAPPPQRGSASFRAFPLFGRLQETTHLRQMLARKPPLVTLTGSPGTGKTRLAEELLVPAQELFGPAVYHARLQEVRHARELPDALLSSLSIERRPGDAVDQGVAVLSELPSFLLLDNFEHLLPTGGAAWIQELLRRVPRLTCLITSRDRLGLAEELEHSVAPLPLPASDATLAQMQDCPSVELFVAHAQASRPGFQLAAENAAAVAALCRLLDGLPLAISLVADWARLYTPAEMLANLRRLKSRRLPGRARYPHPTLQAAIQWSYQRLSYDQATFFLRLSVFRGGWSHEAAAHVCLEETAEDEAAADLLALLLDKSLVVSEPTGEQMRFRLLETLRAFGEDELARTPEEQRGVRERHAAYFLTVAEAAKFQLTGAEQALWLRRLETEHDNFRAALAWCLADEAGAELGLRLVAALQQFWYVRGYVREGWEHSEAALNCPGASASTKARAEALNGAGIFAQDQGDVVTAKARLEESLAIHQELNDRGGTAIGLHSLALLAEQMGDPLAARTRYEESIMLFRELGFHANVADALNNLAMLHHAQGEYAVAEELYMQSLDIHRARNNNQGIADALNNLGLIARERGDTAGALAFYQEVLDIYRTLGEQRGIAAVLTNTGLSYASEGNYAAAQQQYAESLKIKAELGSRSAVALTLEAMAELAVRQEQWRRGVCLYAAAEHLRQSIQEATAPIDRANMEANIARLRAALDESDFASEWMRGRVLSLEQTIAYAFSE